MLTPRSSGNTDTPNSLAVLLHSLRTQRLKEGRGATVLLGAGCSLSSTQRDITTAGIIKSIIAEIDGHTNTQKLSNAELYQRFVNYWHSLGTAQGAQLLETHLSDLKPSVGYHSLRTLVDLGFVSTVITTNFDLLLDAVFEGLSYNVIIANHELEKVGDGSARFLVMKVHGDLSRGALRFSPHELNSLPQPISDIIRKETFWPTLVVGYRGQDLGLMSSLSREPDYNAFWVTPHFPDQSDHYTNDPVFQWMSCRRSTSNFIYGDAYGKFDALFAHLESQLSHANEPTSTPPLPILVLHETPWEKSNLLHSGTSSEDAQNFLAIIENSRARYSSGRWTSAPPHFARSYESLLESYLQVLERNLVPIPLANQLDNPRERFLLLSALEFLSRSGGRPDQTGISLLEESRQQIEFLLPDSRSIRGFIEDLSDLLETFQEVNARSLGTSPGTQEATILDKLGDGWNLLEILLLVNAIAACFPTAGPSDLFGGEGLGLKFTLQRAVKDLTVEGTRTSVFLATDDPPSLVPVFRRFFAVLPEAKMDHVHLTFTSRWLACHVSLTSKEDSVRLPTTTTLGELLQRECQRSSRDFLRRPSPFAIAGQHVELSPEKQLHSFLEGSSPACLVVGPSGSGKTTLLKAIVSSLDRSPERLVLARSAAETGEFISLEQIFFGSLAQYRRPPLGEFLRYLGALLASRGLRLLLILDALNEAPGNLDSRTALFRDVLQLAAELSDPCCEQHIQLIVTLRDSTFKQFLAQGLKPSRADFLCPRIASGDDRPYLDLQELDSADQAALIDEYFSKDAGPLFQQFISSNSLLAHDFRHPYLIAVAGHSLRTRSDVRKLGSAADVFADFSKEMLRRIGPEYEQAHAISAIFAYLSTLIGTTGNSFRIVSKMALLLTFPAQDRERASNYLVALQDVNILTSSGEVCGDVLAFSHDRIAEYFIGEFLLTKYDSEDLVRRIIEVGDREPIARGGITHLLLRTLKASRDTNWPTLHNLQVIGPILRSVLRPGTSDFAKEAIARSLMLAEHPRTLLELLWRSLHDVASRNAVAEFPLSQALGEGLRNLLDKYRLPEIAGVTEEIVGFLRQKSPTDGGIPVLLSLQAEAKIRGGRFSEALPVLDAAAQEIQHSAREDNALGDRLSLLRSVAFREMGFKSEAIRYLQQVYLSQRQMGNWAFAADTGLELGAALRDDTRFSEARELYEEIDGHRDRLRDATKLRLVLQLGTIYKNLAQERSGRKDELPTAQSPSQASIHEYQEARRYLDTAIHLAHRSDSPVFLAEALADRAELGILVAEQSPEELSDAKAHLQRLEHVVAYFPIVARMVELCRLRAKICVLEGQIEQAVELIQQGRTLAVENGDSFRVADCDYQLGHLVLRNLTLFPTVEFLQMGEIAFRRAESYYTTSVSPSNIYLERVRSGHRKLLRCGADLGLTLDT